MNWDDRQSLTICRHGLWPESPQRSDLRDTRVSHPKAEEIEHPHPSGFSLGRWEYPGIRLVAAG